MSGTLNRAAGGPFPRSRAMTILGTAAQPITSWNSHIGGSRDPLEPVDDEILAGQEAGLNGRQEGDQLRHILRAAEPA